MRSLGRWVFKISICIVLYVYKSNVVSRNEIYDFNILVVISLWVKVFLPLFCFPFRSITEKRKRCTKNNLPLSECKSRAGCFLKQIEIRSLFAANKITLYISLRTDPTQSNYYIIKACCAAYFGTFSANKTTIIDNDLVEANVYHRSW